MAAGRKAAQALIEKVKAASIDTINKDQLLFLIGNKDNEFNDAMNKALSLAMEVLVDPTKLAEGPQACTSVPMACGHSGSPGAFLGPSNAQRPG